MKIAGRLALVGATVALMGAGPALGSAEADPASGDPVARGAYLYAAGGCASCHLPPGVESGPPAGGRPIKTDFGTFYGSNITPHPDAGIGAFTEADFVRALRHGRAPDGRRYWPAFPYPSYTGMADGDLADLYAYLMAQAPEPSANRPHEVAGRLKIPLALPLWRALYFDPGPLEEDPSQDPALRRGAYLVKAVSHCGECHTPRTALGGLREDRALSGAPYKDGLADNLTPDPTTGLAGWSQADWRRLLRDALTPEGDVVGGEMAGVVDRGTSHLTEADLDAMIAYLRALPPISGLGGGPSGDADDEDDDEEELW